MAAVREKNLNFLETLKSVAKNGDFAAEFEQKKWPFDLGKPLFEFNHLDDSLPRGRI